MKFAVVTTDNIKGLALSDTEVASLELHRIKVQADVITATDHDWSGQGPARARPNSWTFPERRHRQ